MSFFSKILFLSFVINTWTAPLLMDNDALSENIEIFKPSLLNDNNAKDQKINIIRPSKPIAKILDPYHRGIYVIKQIATKSYRNLLNKVPQTNYQYDLLMNNQSIPMSVAQSKQMSTNGKSDIWNKLSNFINLNLKEKQNIVLPSATSESQLVAQIDPLSVVPKNCINKQTINRRTIGNLQTFYSSRFTNQDNLEGTKANTEHSDKLLSESGANRSELTITTSTVEKLQTTTVIPTEFESITTFETTTEILTTKSNEEEIILDKNAEIDEAGAFNIDDGDISSTQESTTEF